ncbi:MAG: hypothetical protein AB7O60_17980 [Variibacter sp.]
MKSVPMKSGFRHARRPILRNGTRRSKTNDTSRQRVQYFHMPRLYILPHSSPEWAVFLAGIERNFHTLAVMLAKAVAVRVKQKCLPGKV